MKCQLLLQGRQEDAEEFLGCVLNGLHDEMLAATNLYSGQGINVDYNFLCAILSVVDKIVSTI